MSDKHILIVPERGDIADNVICEPKEAKEWAVYIKEPDSFVWDFEVAFPTEAAAREYHQKHGGILCDHRKYVQAHPVTELLVMKDNGPQTVKEAIYGVKMLAVEHAKYKGTHEVVGGTYLENYCYASYGEQLGLDAIQGILHSTRMSLEAAAASSIPFPVIFALMHVRKYCPDVTRVKIDKNGCWLYENDDGTVPSFVSGPGKNISGCILQDAADSVKGVHSYELPLYLR